MIIDWSLKTIKEEVDKITFAESDRYMASLGFNHKINKKISIDGAYSLLVFADSKSEYRNKCRFNQPEDDASECTGIGGTFRGEFSDTYANILSLQINSKFLRQAALQL